MSDQSSDKQVLVIVGATATGKTSLALKLAAELNGDLLSADSRQVYQGLDIVTGKDIPEDFQQHKLKLSSWPESIVVYTNGQINIWGLDMVEPNQPWSAGQFQRFAKAVVSHIHEQGKLPIVVGGTGLYLRSLVENLPLTGKPDINLRARLEKLSLKQLQQQLRSINPSGWQKMNQSDRSNPRRLIRALEKSEGDTGQVKPNNEDDTDYLLVGLRAPMTVLEERIRQRVRSRLKADLHPEVELLAKFPEEAKVAKSAIGYDLLSQYFEGQINRQQLVDSWSLRERQYAKRQQVWFKKQAKINWFDITQKDWYSQVVAKVGSWYHQN